MKCQSHQIVDILTYRGRGRRRRRRGHCYRRKTPKNNEFDGNLLLFIERIDLRDCFSRKKIIFMSRRRAFLIN